MVDLGTLADQGAPLAGELSAAQPPWAASSPS